jgi:hypothetical protein
MKPYLNWYHPIPVYQGVVRAETRAKCATRKLIPLTTSKATEYIEIISSTSQIYHHQPSQGNSQQHRGEGSIQQQQQQQQQQSL